MFNHWKLLCWEQRRAVLRQWLPVVIPSCLCPCTVPQLALPSLSCGPCHTFPTTRSVSSLPLGITAIMGHRYWWERVLSLRTLEHGLSSNHLLSAEISSFQGQRQSQWDDGRQNSNDWHHLSDLGPRHSLVSWWIAWAFQSECLGSSLGSAKVQNLSFISLPTWEMGTTLKGC